MLLKRQTETMAQGISVEGRKNAPNGQLKKCFLWEAPRVVVSNEGMEYCFQLECQRLDRRAGM